MIISPPVLKTRNAQETDAAWLDRVMASDENRGFPLSTAGSWHGGLHIRHTDRTSNAEMIRAIADGTVVSLRKSSDKRDLAPLNINADKPDAKGSDDGYVLLKHETEIGSGKDAKVVFYSLYMHLKSLAETVKTGEKICRKDPLGTSGMVDAVNAFHFQIFCDDENMSKLAGRKTGELDVTQNGRTDAVYGDIHFYLPSQTKFYDKAPADNSTSISGLSELYTSNAPLYASMTLAQGSCTMVTRQKNTQVDKYDLLGEPLVNADGEDYEYNLYKTAMRNYKESPSAGFELLRFGRIINTEHETLVPSDAPLWMTVSYPGGKGVVNLADPGIKKFSDADFPHWTGWKLVDDDADSNSQCSSATIKKLQENGDYDNQCAKLICHFPFEWEKSTIDTRFSWLKTGSDEHDPMTEADYAKFKAHAEALCLDSGDFNNVKLWNFNPGEFIRHFRKNYWLGEQDIIRLVRKNEGMSRRNGLEKETITEWITSEGKNEEGEVIRPADIKKIMPGVLMKYQINTPLRISHFFGQMARETGRFKFFVEKGENSYFDIYEPATVQGNKLGNTEIGDGVRFKGRGAVHLTGRFNYSTYSCYRFGPQVNGREYFTVSTNNILPVTNAYYAFDAGGYYWVSKQKYVLTKKKKIVESGKLSVNYWADKGPSGEDASEVTRRINPGRDGFSEVRLPSFLHAWYVMNDEIEPTDDYRPINS